MEKLYLYKIYIFLLRASTKFKPMDLCSGRLTFGSIFVVESFFFGGREGGSFSGEGWEGAFFQIDVCKLYMYHHVSINNNSRDLRKVKDLGNKETPKMRN